MLRRLVLGLALLGAGACEASRVGPETVPNGTWGGDDAGLIVTSEAAHAHIGCTLGDVAAPIALDAEGRFDLEVQWNVDAFPVDRGIRHPARLSGRTDGHTLTLAVRLSDTGQTFGPVLLTLGTPPRMQNCPICRRGI
ncbi:MAG TPA: hypothetical protein VGN09_03325 [Vicinamibacteria bacterium]|jgi:hypothetical protein